MNFTWPEMGGNKCKQSDSWFHLWTELWAPEDKKLFWSKKKGLWFVILVLIFYARIPCGFNCILFIRSFKQTFFEKVRQKVVSFQNVKEKIITKINFTLLLNITVIFNTRNIHCTLQHFTLWKQMPCIHGQFKLTSQSNVLQFNCKDTMFILASVSFWPLLIIELVPRSVPAGLIVR